jgi:hypothetical protein
MASSCCVALDSLYDFGEWDEKQRLYAHVHYKLSWLHSQRSTGMTDGAMACLHSLRVLEINCDEEEGK